MAQSFFAETTECQYSFWVLVLHGASAQQYHHLFDPGPRAYPYPKNTMVEVIHA
jgi:hypothetical protein